MRPAAAATSACRSKRAIRPFRRRSEPVLASGQQSRQRPTQRDRHPVRRLQRQVGDHPGWQRPARPDVHDHASRRADRSRLSQRQVSGPDAVPGRRCGQGLSQSRGATQPLVEEHAVNGKIYGVPIPLRPYFWWFWTHQESPRPDVDCHADHAPPSSRTWRSRSTIRSKTCGRSRSNGGSQYAFDTVQGLWNAVFERAELLVGRRQRQVHVHVRDDRVRQAMVYATDLVKADLYHPSQLSYNVISGRTDFRARKIDLSRRRAQEPVRRVLGRRQRVANGSAVAHHAGPAVFVRRQDEARLLLRSTQLRHGAGQERRRCAHQGDAAHVELLRRAVRQRRRPPVAVWRRGHGLTTTTSAATRS